MKLNIATRQRNEDDNLIPLINIVFLLLIFFMLAGTFTKPERFDVAPPRSLSPAMAEEQEMVVLLSADGRMAIGERDFNKVELKRLIIDRLSVESELKIQLKADGRMEAELVIEVMDIFRAAGVKKLMLLTELDKL